MVTIIPENERRLLSYEEIKKEFDGKWVFLTHAELTQGLRIIRGIPTVLADKIYENAKSRIYDEFKKAEYGQTTTTDLRKMSGMHVVSPLYEVG
jgi:hypothetical protein